MANTIIRTGLLSLMGACAVVTSVQAGGFSRGDADTDILYEDGTVVLRGGYVYVMPDRGYDTVNGASGTDDAFTDNYGIPSFAAKFRVSENFSCAATYTQPFGADSTYGEQAQAADRTADIAAGGITGLLGGNAVKEASFDTDEIGGTCDISFAAGKGRLHLLGGVFTESFSYTEVKDFGTLEMEDSSAFGYRLGAAYDITEYALRAEIMYRSQIDHEASGTFTSTSTLAAIGIPTGSVLDATGYGSLPQSLELNLQSGIAPGWLAFGSVKWTDWSVLQTLNYTIDGLGDLEKNFFWRDGWTITGGVGHTFTDKVSGALSLTWDRGVGTGADIVTDTWTLGAGTQIKAGPGVLRLGGAVSYLTEGEQSVTDGADFDATADADWAYAVSASYKISF
ncbi:long-chain fatty acid transporter [Rhizobium sp. CG5]|uniref:OmpP1/FadL family transporter n=1 Tax=Rhizobium sp. CG5 TaxID=2726076 RepID=UPI0020338F72|nr:outer membrane protein transport protein [Rhizobium sp. CG5]MCM2472181.1 long-chain fatty acid transporter [Rhizobium sp. CG5]